MTRDFLDDNGGLRVWFRDEIRNALLAAYATSKATTGLDRSPEAVAFRRGFTSAIIAIGLNFGISPLTFMDEEQQACAHHTIMPNAQVIDDESEQ